MLISDRCLLKSGSRWNSENQKKNFFLLFLTIFSYLKKKTRTAALILQGPKLKLPRMENDFNQEKTEVKRTIVFFWKIDEKKYQGLVVVVIVIPLLRGVKHKESRASYCLIAWTPSVRWYFFSRWTRAPKWRHRLMYTTIDESSQWQRSQKGGKLKWLNEGHWNGPEYPLKFAPNFYLVKLFFALLDGSNVFFWLI